MRNRLPMEFESNSARVSVHWLHSELTKTMEDCRCPENFSPLTDLEIAMNSHPCHLAANSLELGSGPDWLSVSGNSGYVGLCMPQYGQAA
jgi:hypothetical protein